jgi:glycine/D-amino acid oxidase-like deaminating enzyme/nitrite reductase/ring-hydroxylating ferredoxin subunit
MGDIQSSSAGALAADLTADAVVVGAGIAGLTTAYCLSREGLNVIVLDAGEIGSGETGRTTAHLTHAMDDRFVALEEMHGAEKVRLVADSHTAAIDRIEAIVRDEELDCDFTRLDGFLFATPGESPDLLDRELSAARRAGLSQVLMAARAPLSHFNTGRALQFPSQAQFHPMKYLSGLASAITRRGGRVFTGSPVAQVAGGREAHVKTSGNWVVRAGSVVIATNSPIVSRVAIASRQSGYRTYALAAPVPGGSVPQALYWDTGQPYHYVRIQKRPGSDLLIVGGEDHKTGQSDDAVERWEKLETWTRERFDGVGEVEYRWSGQVMETVDCLAFIGRNPLDDENVFIATGDSGQGMTHGTIAGMLLTDLIMKRANPWAELYNPSRIPVRAIGRFVQETLNTAAQYGAWVTAGDVDDVNQIQPRSGAIVRRGLRKIAVYRDDAGSLHERSAICTHLGCMVNWNSAEATWDCPCHGSRFDPYGKVLMGPAKQDLAVAEDEAGEQPRKSA